MTEASQKHQWTRVAAVPRVGAVADWVMYRDPRMLRATARFAVTVTLRDGDVVQFVRGMRRFAEEVIAGGGTTTPDPTYPGTGDDRPKPGTGDDKPTPGTVTTPDTITGDGTDSEDGATLKDGPEPGGDTGGSTDDDALRNAINPLPSYYLKPPFGVPPEPGPAQFTLMVNAAFFTLLATDPTSDNSAATLDQITQLVLGGVLPDDCYGPETPLPQIDLPEGVSECGPVITAVIDGGMPLAHARFRDGPLSSRIEYAWVQDGPHREPAVSHVAEGREFTKAQIDQLLQDSATNGAVDEDLFYRLSKQADYAEQSRTLLGQSQTHGAGVMDLAAGRETRVQRPSQPDNPIIAVQVPELATADTSGGQLVPFVTAALSYIADRADRIAMARGTKRLPLVINFSYGFIAGPHDGTSVLERAMDNFLAARTPGTGLTNIVLPAGNRFLSRCHATLQSSSMPDGRRDLTLRVQPDDHTISIVEFWLPRTDDVPEDPRIAISVTTPDGVTGPEVTETEGDMWVWDPDGVPLGTLSYAFEGPPTSRGRFTLVVAPTRSLGGQSPVAPSGDWIFHVRDLGLKIEDRVEAWVQRDDTLIRDVIRGRQAYFRDAEYLRFNPPDTSPIGDIAQVDADDSVVRKEALINAIGTGGRVIVTSGVYERSGHMAVYSAGGYTLDPAMRDAPDAAAISDTSRTHVGLLTAGSRSGSVLPLDGTSVAAPRVARRIAGSIADGVPVDRQQIAAWAVVDDNTDFADRPPKQPQLRVGAGRINTPTGRDMRRIDFP